MDVRPVQADVISDLFGELEGLAKTCHTLLTATEVGEVAAEHGQRPDLCFACAESSGERERLLGDWQRLRMTPHHRQRPRE